MSTRKLGANDLLEVGISAVFNPDPSRKDGPRYAAFIRGWQEGQYIFLELKADQQRTLVFKQMGRCVVRFLKDGYACAFDANMVDWQVSRQQPYFRVSWPKSVSYLSVRKHQRIDVDEPCLIRGERGNEFHGTVRDLSSTGMGVFVFEDCEVGAKLRIQFELPDGSTISDAEIIVRSKRKTPDGLFLGCELPASEEDAREVINFYVTTTLARLRRDGDGESSLVLIDPDEASTAGYVRTLERLGYQIAVAENVVDGFFRVRLVRPEALLICQDQGDAGIDGVTMCRLVKQSPGFEELPIFLYGGSNVSVDQAKSAQAAAYLPALSDDHGLTRILAEHLEKRNADPDVAE